MNAETMDPIEKLAIMVKERERLRSKVETLNKNIAELEAHRDSCTRQLEQMCTACDTHRELATKSLGVAAVDNAVRSGRS